MGGYCSRVSSLCLAEQRSAPRLPALATAWVGSCALKTADVCDLQAADGECGPHGCGFSCQCHSCHEKPTCDCSCRWLVVAGMALLVLSGVVDCGPDSSILLKGLKPV